MGRPVPRPLVLDAGALIAFDRRDRSATILVQRARELDSAIYVPAGVVAQVWRNGSRQARLAALLSSPTVLIVDLNLARAKAVGKLCGARATNDVIDAPVVILARQIGGTIATSDSDDIHRLDPSLIVVKV